MNLKAKLVLQTRMVPTIMVFLAAYFLARVFFRFFVEAKQVFIYPSGLLVKGFLNVGDFIAGEWLFVVWETQFVLGESCSGTSFFCLLFAYVAYSIYNKGAHLLWFITIYPITIFANSVRVISSIYAQSFAKKINYMHFQDDIHLTCGVLSFLMIFISVVVAMEYLSVEKVYETN